jgi:hypothetical protein
VQHPEAAQGRRPDLGGLRLLARVRSVRRLQDEGGGARQRRRRQVVEDHLQFMGVQATASRSEPKPART